MMDDPLWHFYKVIVRIMQGFGRMSYNRDFYVISR